MGTLELTMNPLLRGLIADALKILVIEMPVFIKKFREVREAARQGKKAPSPRTDAVMQRLEAIEGAIEALTKATDDLARAVVAHEKRIHVALAFAAVSLALAILVAVLSWWR
jgi:hypothetical protein